MYVVSMTAKIRLSATVDADVLESVQAAVAAGEAESVSAYVNDALRLKAEHDRRLRGIDRFIAAYEAEHGVITEEEMEAAYRRAKERAIVVRGNRVSDDKSTGVA
jgi:Arc/MetJ-type ribon-helix-helix transcriptional regulator